MSNILKRIYRKATCQLMPEGEKGIWEMGHRGYVGGMWIEIGKLQFKFLINQGLKPTHCLLDIACGSLRGGIHFIKYLESGNYLGIDKEFELIELGKEKELGNAVFEEKKPEFVVSDKFEFEKFSKRPHFSIAHSLFTHINPHDIRLCLRNLRAFVDSRHILFATFFEGKSSRNREVSHSHSNFRYSKLEMEIFGRDTGWKTTYIGNWNHPRNQMMMKYEVL